MLIILVSCTVYQTLCIMQEELCGETATLVGHVYWCHSDETCLLTALVSAPRSPSLRIGYSGYVLHVLNIYIYIYIYIYTFNFDQLLA